MRKLFLISILFICTASFAQDFEVSPLKFFFNAEPGDAQTKYVNIKNHSNKIEAFIFSISDYNIDNKGNEQYIDAGSLKHSIADWISISPAFFELNPNEEKQVAITIQQPVDEYGSKWGIVFVRTAKEQSTYSVDKSVTAGLVVSGRIAINIYQTPGTNKSYKATINNLMEITSKTDTTRIFSMLINNLEDIITDCKIFFIATEIQTAEETTFDEYTFVIYPKSSRKVELQLPDILPRGTYSLAAILDYGSKTNLEGAQIIIEVE